MLGNTGSRAVMDDELDLFELVASLWARKWLIVGVTLAFILGGLLYVFSVASVYEASAKLTPPTSADLVGSPVLADLAINSHRITPQKTFNRGLDQLADAETLMSVFMTHQTGFGHEGGDPSEGLEQFRALVKVVKPKKNGNGSATLRFRHQDSEYARDIVVALVAQANTDASQALADDMRASLLNHIALRQTRLDQAVSMRKETDSKDSESYRLQYLDDTIAALQLKVNTLNVYAEQSYETVNMLQLHEEVAIPSRPAKPNRKLILLLCVMGGGFLGVLAALVLEALAKRKVEAAT